MRHTLIIQTCIGIAVLLFAGAGLISCSHPPVEQNEPAVVGGLTQPLSSFNQVIQSSVSNLSVAASEKFELPVRIENPGAETWLTTGTDPVNAYYKWFKDGKMLPIEGERTPLPKPISPKMSADMILHVVAPGQPGKYELRVTLVQEGVTWFMTKSNTYLALPVSVR
jgi:hypothetical protein